MPYGGYCGRLVVCIFNICFKNIVLKIALCLGMDEKKNLSDYYWFCWNWFFTPCNLAVTLMKHGCCHFYVEGFISDVHEISEIGKYKFICEDAWCRSLRTAVRKGHCLLMLLPDSEGQGRNTVSIIFIFWWGKWKYRFPWPDWESECFAFICGKGANNLHLTHREGKKGCFCKVTYRVLLEAIYLQNT